MVSLKQHDGIRLWGKITTHTNQPLAHIPLKLVKCTHLDSTPHYETIAYTLSDHEGFYQFHIHSDEKAWYKVVVEHTQQGKKIMWDDAHITCSYST